MSIFRRLVESGLETRAFNPTAIPRNSEHGWASTAGEYVTEMRAMQHATVFSCVRLLSDSIASLPLDAYRKAGDIRKEITPTPQLVARPFAPITQWEWTWQIVSSLALRGNAYGLVVARDKLEYPTQIMPLHPDDVAVHQEVNYGPVEYRVNGVLVDKANIFHVKRFALSGCAEGLSPISANRVGIGLALAAEQYGARYFADSASPSSVLESEQTLTDDQVQRTQKSWVSTHGGRRRPAILSGGLKWRPISITPNESQFLETRKFQRGEIAMLYGIPPHMIGDTDKTTSWGSGIESQSIGWVQYTLNPWLSCIEAALTELSPRSQFVRFKVDGLLRGDQKARFDAYVQARNAGWMNVDEIRALEDMPPIPDGSGQAYIQPLNMGPLGAPPPAPSTPPTDEGQPT